MLAYPIGYDDAWQRQASGHDDDTEHMEQYLHVQYRAEAKLPNWQSQIG
jgi:hypothetical protein